MAILRSTLAAFTLLLCLVSTATARSEPEPGVGQRVAMGNWYYEQFFELYQPHLLVRSEENFRIALAEVPDNIQLQLRLYQVIYLMARLDPPDYLSKLQTYFKELHPEARKVTYPPTFLEYLIAKQENYSTGEQLGLLTRAAAEQPFASIVWLHMSDIFLARGKLDLALQASKFGNLHDDSGTTQQKIAEVYHQLGIRNICTQQHMPYLTKSIKYYTSAVKSEPENVAFKAGLANLYLDAGLTPLGLKVATDAHDTDVTSDTSKVLIEALYQSGDIKGARKKAIQFLRKHEDPDVVMLLANIYIAEENPKKAYKLWKKYPLVMPGDFSGEVLVNWLTQKAGKKAAAGQLHPSNDWQKQVIAYLDNPGEEGTLIKAASNQCETSQAYFYRALQAGLYDSDADLNAVLKLRVNGSTEFRLAKAVIDRDK